MELAVGAAWLLLMTLALSLTMSGPGQSAEKIDPERVPSQNQASDQVQDQLQVQEGKKHFVKATCWGCHPHGENALHGDKPLKGPAFSKRFKSDEDIVAFVRRGSKFGMPPFPKSKLSDNDLRSIIVYIRSLSKKSDTAHAK